MSIISIQSCDLMISFFKIIVESFFMNKGMKLKNVFNKIQSWDSKVHNGNTMVDIVVVCYLLLLIKSTVI
ncbi:hypothetical protein Hanom_Chr01g00058331 [Helianthus anomalus]|nr:hypothetical protein HanIR_Chr12g0591811 [Helianthus annuus]